MTKESFEAMIREELGYAPIGNSRVYQKRYLLFDCTIRIDCDAERILYPKDVKVSNRATCNFSKPENFVVLECVDRLLEKGYRPEHIELEKEWPLGHEMKGGRADICVSGQDGKLLFIIECKTFGREYTKEYNKTRLDGGQLFSYWKQEGSCKWLILYASEFENGKLSYDTESIDCSDDANILLAAQKDDTVKLYRDAHTVEEFFSVWDETYDKRFCGDVIFRKDSQAYSIGVKPLRKGDLRDFSESDKVVNKFEEILRHNNVSDKENAFNCLTALFICKLVDEMQKRDEDVVEFQYKVGTDTYESLQDRLQRLHQEGMEKFMREKMVYVPNDYAEKLVQQYTGQKRQNMIADLKKTFRILKFYTNSDFAFKNVHNDELFYQNGKILVEVIQLFQKYRIIGSNDIQTLGDLFEQLLNKGFKQNEGQFFTPIPITRFIWDSLPLESVVRKGDKIEFPKIIDYACGAGHFLTEGFEAVNACVHRVAPDITFEPSWAESRVYGVEKDYRLARVSKISMFMHGAGDGNIIFGDGLENYPDKNIVPGSFDILVANPPYAVKAFKPYLKLRNNTMELRDCISNDGSEIETLFIERISQLLKPGGIAAVILPGSILNKENESFIGAREFLLKNFYIRAIARFGSKTFGATGTNTVILFLEKFDEPPRRVDLVEDSVAAIFGNADLSDSEDGVILQKYLQKIRVTAEDYGRFISRTANYEEWEKIPYFAQYVAAFTASSEYTAKSRQKSFVNAPDSDRLKWCNQHFYDFAAGKEKEKLFYFALVYRQRTVIVSAPEENKKQEEFLGYKWSDRKGGEGIQILRAGGTLYHPQKRDAENTMAWVVRSSFSEQEVSASELEEYFYYLPLEDMIDFSGVNFNKAIRITRIRSRKEKKGFQAYKLSEDIFSVGIGNRVLTSELEEDGSTPIYSANVREEFGRTNKRNLTDFSVPSILWGIDGDWMVNYIPAEKPFYPTDHCGVLRVYSDKIIPEYMAIALQVEGEHEKFSRSNRASTQRVKSLTVQVPEPGVQKIVVEEISEAEKKISGLKGTLAQMDKTAQSEFWKRFGGCAREPLGSYVEQIRGVSYKPTDLRRPSDDDAVALLRANNITDGAVNFEKMQYVSKEKVSAAQRIRQGDILLCGSSGSLEHVGKAALCSPDAYDMTFGAFCKVMRPLGKLLPEYIATYLESDEYRIRIMQAAYGANINNLKTEHIDGLQIPVPSDELQMQFEDLARQHYKEKFEIIASLKQAESQKEELIEKYFRG